VTTKNTKALIHTLEIRARGF